MAGSIFRSWPHIEYGDVADLQISVQFILFDDLSFMDGTQIDRGELVEVRLRERRQRSEIAKQCLYLLVGKPIVDVSSCAASIDQPGLVKYLQMMRGVGPTLANLNRNGVDGPLPLGQHIDDFKTTTC